MDGWMGWMDFGGSEASGNVNGGSLDGRARAPPRCAAGPFFLLLRGSQLPLSHVISQRLLKAAALGASE